MITEIGPVWEDSELEDRKVGIDSLRIDSEEKKEKVGDQDLRLELITVRESKGRDLLSSYRGR